MKSFISSEINFHILKFLHIEDSFHILLSFARFNILDNASGKVSPIDSVIVNWKHKILKLRYFADHFPSHILQILESHWSVSIGENAMGNIFDLLDELLI